MVLINGLSPKLQSLKNNNYKSGLLKTIGIVGGVGSYAGIDLARKIFDLTIVKCDQDHLPVSLLSLPHKIVDRTEFLLGQVKENPGISISEIIQHLHACGASVVGIPCNTAHAKPIFDEIEKRIPQGVILINMLDELARFIKEYFPNYKDIGVLSTSGSFKTGLYKDYLSEYGLNAIHVTEEIQENYIHPAIYNEDYGIKVYSDPVSERAKINLHIGIDHLISKGVQAIVLGCTELPLALKGKRIKGIPLIDPTQVLARSLILEFSPDSLNDQKFQSGEDSGS